MSKYSRLPGSVSEQGSVAASGSGFDMKELAAVIQASVEAGLTARGAGNPPAREGATCMYCRRASCPMLSGGKPCREANRAAGMLREALNKERDDKKQTPSSSE